MFDKTGTLTIGKPQVVDMRMWIDMPLPAFYELIAAAEVLDPNQVRIFSVFGYDIFHCR